MSNNDPPFKGLNIGIPSIQFLLRAGGFMIRALGYCGFGNGGEVKTAIATGWQQSCSPGIIDLVCLAVVMAL